MTGDKTPDGPKKSVVESIGVLAGKTPNEMMARTGQLVTSLGVMALLGIDISWITVGKHAVAAPYFAIMLGVILSGVSSHLRFKADKCQK